MRTGKLIISRGHELSSRRAVPASEAAPVTVAPVSFIPSDDAGALHLVEVRLNALERLTRLVEQGAISIEEFALEKSLILRLTGDELLLDEPVAEPEAPGPSLAGRLVGWRGVVLASLVGFGAWILGDPAGAAGLLEQIAGFVGA